MAKYYLCKTQDNRQDLKIKDEVLDKKNAPEGAFFVGLDFLSDVLGLKINVEVGREQELIVVAIPKRPKS